LVPFERLGLVDVGEQVVGVDLEEGADLGRGGVEELASSEVPLGARLGDWRAGILSAR
jgi:hypothetical protein